MWATPPRSPTMVGIDVATIVWSSAAMSMPASRAEKIRLIRRLVRTIGGGLSGSGAGKRALLGRAGPAPRVRGAGWPRPWARPERARGGEDEALISTGAGQPGGDLGPGLVDEVGQRGGEVGGQPAVQRGAHGHGADAGEQHRVQVVDARAGAPGDGLGHRPLR